MLFLIVPDPNRGIWNKTKLKLDFWCFTFLYSASYFWQNYNTTMNILYLTEKCFHIYLCFQRVSKSVISSVMCARVKFTALLWGENIPSEYWKNRILSMSLKLRLARGSNKLPKAHQRISFISIFMRLDLNGKGEFWDNLIYVRASFPLLCVHASYSSFVGRENPLWILKP